MSLSFQTSTPSAVGRRFRLIEQVGRGAFGVVYLAEQQSRDGDFSRLVALKLLHPHRGDDASAQRLRDEARILGRVCHRNVVAVSDLVHLRTNWAIVMEYVPGADLRQVLDALSLTGELTPVAAALEIGAAVAAALHAAYSAPAADGRSLHALHRDIKPSNVRLTPDGDVKVLDFGTAWTSHAGRETDTADDLVVGTLGFLPPERLRGHPATAAGDVYAAAKLLVELLVGESTGPSPVIERVHAGWLRDLLERLQTRLGPSSPTSSLVCPIVERALAFDPTARPNAAELSDQLYYLARGATEDTLRAFAARLVPLVGALIGEERVPSTGVLEESSASYEPWDGGGDLPDRALCLPSNLPPPLLFSEWSDVEQRLLDDAARWEGNGDDELSLSSNRAIFVPPYPRRPRRWRVVGGLALVGLFSGSSLAAWGALQGDELAYWRTGAFEYRSSVVVETPSALPAPAEAQADPPSPPETAAPRRARPASTSSVDAPADDGLADVEWLALPLVAVDARELSSVEQPALPDEPAPTPSPRVSAATSAMSPFLGKWIGTAEGRPLIFHIEPRDLETLEVTAELYRGREISSFDFSAEVTAEGTLVLTTLDASVRFEGRVSGGVISGTWRIGDEGKTRDVRLERQ